MRRLRRREALDCAVVGIPLVKIRRSFRGFCAPTVTHRRGQRRRDALTVPAVRRARQAIGRVIRGVDEVGVRALVGRRYTPDARHSVAPYLPAGEREEFTRMTPDFLASQRIRSGPTTVPINRNISLAAEGIYIVERVYL